jgi:hypothetical protein
LQKRHMLGTLARVVLSDHASDQWTEKAGSPTQMSHNPHSSSVFMTNAP